MILDIDNFKATPRQSLFLDTVLSRRRRDIVGVLPTLQHNITLLQLNQGTLVKVFPSLIKRRKNHFHSLPCGISVIVGNNGYVWISPHKQEIPIEECKDEIENYELQVSVFCFQMWHSQYAFT